MAPTMAVEQVLHMNGGEGETSYANNSSFQRGVMLKAKDILEESIINLYHTTSPDCFKVADLGSSSGPNAVLLVYDIINIVSLICLNLKHKPPMFQFFLNDLFGNDFNTIFQSLPDLYKRLEKEKGHDFGPCFISATPGTFYGRLFPNNSIHFFHSSYSLHWLSQTPKELGKGAEIALNKGNVYITKTSPETVHKAYMKQFEEDFKVFLRSRSEELMPGGGMVLTFVGRDHKFEVLNAWVVIGMALNDMVSENLVEEAKLDSFNIPSYCPTAEEVRQVIEAEGSFNLQRLETIKMGWIINPEERANNIRSVTEPLLEAQFGELIMDELFLRFKTKLVQLMEVGNTELPNLVMYMTKNA